MRIVIALGGNALGIDPKIQKQNTDLTAKYLAKIIKMGHEVIITHGNGPQVGLINLAFEEGSKNNKNIYMMPLSECGAMSQGYIGYHLSNSLLNEFNKNDIKKNVVSVNTNVLVDKDDDAFKNPTKPIGSFYTKEEALKFGCPVKEDSGRGWRRVVASPRPQSILEKAEIETLIKSGFVVICCGGGGTPVIYDNGYKGVDAVIDKDFASSKLATEIDADMLMILTAVSNAKINFGKENETDLKNVTLDECNKYLLGEEFKNGSMKPKVIACMDFVKNGENKKAVITDIEHALDAVNLKEGTIITK